MFDSGTPSAGVAPGNPSPSRSVPAESPLFDWKQLDSLFAGSDPGIPDTVMRSLLEATLKEAAEKRVYGLPEVEYWVVCPDQYLAGRGIDRITFRGGPEMERLQGWTSHTSVQFPLCMPPLGVTGGTLFLVLMGATMFSALVTQRNRFGENPGADGLMLSWRAHARASGAPQPLRISRVAPGRRTARGSDVTRAVTAQRTGTYVIPHIRVLHAGGQPSARALQAAQEHGISLPAGYTFVRGHFRGAATEGTSPQYALTDITLETIRRFRTERTPSRR